MFGMCVARERAIVVSSLKTFSLALLTSSYLSIVPVQAQSPANAEDVTDYAIESGSLGSAISEFGKRSNLQILYPSNLVRGKSSDGLSGSMSKGRALKQLLDGSGLGFRFVDENTVTLIAPTSNGSSSTSTSEGLKGALETIFVYASESDEVGVIRVDNEEIQTKYAGNMNALLRAQAGVFTRAPIDEEALTINIRGMQGGGRVNTMIDGVPQNFRNISGHGGTSDPLIFIDPFLIQSVDVKKGQARGADGMGTLSGAVNIKTIDVDDILLPGRQVGFMTKFETSNNGLKLGMVGASAARFSNDQFGEGDIMAALTYRNKDAYTDGRGNKVPADPNVDDKRQPTSGLFKISYTPNDEHDFRFKGDFLHQNRLKFTGNAGPDTSYRRIVDKLSASGTYTYTPDNPFISLRAKAHVSKNDLRHSENTGGTFAGRTGTNVAYGFDITNISSFSPLDGIDVKLEYGGALQADDYEGNEKRGGNPDGSLVKSGIFGDANIEWNNFTLSAGLRHDMWETDGVRSFHRAGTNGCPAGGNPCPKQTTKKSGADLNPSIGLSYEPTDWLKLFGRYALSSRAPTVSEMFASFHDFSGLGTPAVNNPNLIPEKQKGLDIGFKVAKDDLVLEGDHFTFGMNYFHNTIDNYIGVGVNPTMTTREYLNAIADAINNGRFAEMAVLGPMAQQIANEQMQWQNAAQKVRMSGIELQAGYDAGNFYFNGSAAFMRTNQPYNNTAVGLGNDIGRQPKVTAMLDVGTRWFDQKLTLGGRVRYTKKSIQQRAFSEDLTRVPPLQVIVTGGGPIDVPSYTLFDVYSKYEHNENLEVFASVDNVFDKYYRPASSSAHEGVWNQSTTSTQGAVGPGRTFKFGMQLKF